MRRFLIFLIGMVLFLQHGHGQIQLRDSVWLETFDNASPPSGWQVVRGSWKPNSVYYKSPTKSYWGAVPTNGDSIVLETRWYNCIGLSYVSLQFDHICKVSPLDKVRIEYRLSGQASWTVIPNVVLTTVVYQGGAVNYATTGFNAESYLEWRADDSAALPNPSWWKKELFDLGLEVGGDEVQFRFIIKSGNVFGTEISLGWLIDNFELTATNYLTDLPTVHFLMPLIKDTIYSSIPNEVNAKVKTNTNVPIVHPYLTWTIDGINYDSVLMTKVGTGDSLWKASIPPFLVGSTVYYHITGKDAYGNAATVSSKYYIERDCGNRTTDYIYTGYVQTASLQPGIYTVEMWGANGGSTAWKSGGKGGYSKGTLTLSANTILYIYVGEKGTINSAVATPSSFGCGGSMAAQGTATYYGNGASGGGASDIRVLADDLYNRIIVGGGGGGAGSYGSGSAAYAGNGGHGGGMNGLDGQRGTGGTYTEGFGGTQTTGGSANGQTGATNGTFGCGGNSTNNLCGASGGGGWYGGGACYVGGGAGGGSGYVLTPTSHKPNGYFAQHASYYITNEGTYAFGESGFIANPDVSGNGLVRITITTGVNCDDTNSVAIYSIDMKDTIATSPGTQTPIVVTVRNKGVADLDSVMVSYSVNGGSISSKKLYLNPALPWDFDYQDTIGYYSFRASTLDTLTVWVSYPNGVLESTTHDDTLTKRIYGRGDIFAEWVTVPEDTVFITGTHEITAMLSAISGAQITVVTLYTESTLGGKDTLPMLLQGSNLWTANVPSYLYGSDVTYTLKTTDFLGNVIKLSGTYFIKKVCFDKNSTGDYVFTGNVQPVTLKAGIYEIEMWGANGGSTQWNSGGKGGYSKGTLTLSAPTQIYIYVAERGKTSSAVATPSSFGGGGAVAAHTNTGYISNGASGGGASDIRVLADNLNNRILVAGGGGGANSYGNGSTAFSGNGGHGGGLNGLDGQLAGTYLQGGGGTQTAGGAAGNSGTAGSFGFGGGNTSNLVGTGGGGGWYGGGSTYSGSGAGGGSGYVLTSTSNKPSGYFAQNASYYITSGGTYCATESGFVANPDVSGNGLVRITPLIAEDCVFDTNAVALDAIIRPEKTEVAGTTVPILVRIRNMGLNDLDSCYINWRLNGTIQSGTYVYKKAIGSLPDGMTDTITVGYYTPTLWKIDEIAVWVSMPNGKIDPTKDDDTLKIKVWGCSPSMPNVLTVGTGRNFSTINMALQALKECGVTQNMTLELKGTFTESVDLTNMSNYMGNYHLTITSAGNHPDSAIIRPSSGSVYGILLSNMNNFTLKAVTVNAATNLATYAIQFASACTNVLIRDCKLLHSITSTTTTHHVVYKPSGTGIVDNVSFINNMIEGGYNGWYFYGGTGTAAYGNNVVFDSNTVTNQYNYATYPYYVNFTSYSYNTVKSRTTTTTWYGLMSYYSNGPVIGNRVVYSGTTSTIYPMYLGYYHYSTYGGIPTTSYGLVANNEIISSGTGTNNGIYCTYNRADIVNNSIYHSGVMGNHYGIFLTSYANVNMKNNNIVLTSSAGYPVSQNTTTGVAITSDYNNLWSPNYVANINSIPRYTIADWQSAIPSDQTSIRVQPTFVNPANNLKMDDSFVPFLCPITTLVNDDIETNTRTSLTTMGCYTMPPYSLNAALTQISGLRQGNVAGQNDTVRVEVINTGSTLITAVNIEWSVGSTTRGAINHPISLSMGQSVTLTLGEIIYPANDANIKVWINNVNGISDNYRPDDTLNTFVTVCANGYSGKMYIGDNSTFLTIEDAYNALDACGIAGDITFAFETGVYNRSFDFTNNSSRFGNYHLTITSASGDADSVTFLPSVGSFGIMLSNTNNITIKAITVDAETNLASYAVQFIGACTNVLIRDCKLLHSPTTTNSTHFVVYKASGGIVDNISFINNVIDGGYYGWYFYGGTGTAAYGNNVVFDSNTVSNQYNYATYSYYVNFTSYSYNTVISRTATTTWYGLDMNYSNGQIIGNRIMYKGTTSTIYPIRLNYYNYSTYGGIISGSFGLVANNEIIMGGTGTAHGIYSTYSNSNIVHNSIYSSGTSGSRYGINLAAYTTMDIKNNNIVLMSTTASTYPIYQSTTTGVTFTSDYNNLYAPTNVGYAASAARATITAWQSAVSSDKKSLKVLPSFVNSALSLDLTTASFSNDSLKCAVYTGVSIDINDKLRDKYNEKLTARGAYERPYNGQDLMVLQIPHTVTEIIDKQRLSISVDVLNAGAVTITDATFGWSLNGQVQSTNIPYTFVPALSPYEQLNIPIAKDTVSGNVNDTRNIVVWVESINSIPDSVKWNDTASVKYTIVPLAKFVDTLNNTTFTLSFDVSTKIFEGTDATITTPKMYIQTIIGSCYHHYDTITMVKDNDKWVANIPKQYYNSKVICELHLSDNVGNHIVLMDSTYIELTDGVIGGDYSFTGNVQPVQLRAGRYEIEMWGAESGVTSRGGSTSGKGGYTKGTITLPSSQTLYLYVGQQGGTGITGGTVPPAAWNGGGIGKLGTGGSYISGGGGGATDIRLTSGTWDNGSSLVSRIMVAGGGGGTGNSASAIGGHGGGLIGIAGTYATTSGNGGTQTSGGTTVIGGTAAVNSGSLGKGGDGDNTTASYPGGGGGGGLYGGAGGNSTYGGGGGGSSYISGHSGCVNHVSGVLFTNTTMIAGNTLMPNPAGGTQTGHRGDGFIRITPVGGNIAYVYSGNHLSLVEITSPINGGDEICESSASPVKVILANRGETNYDFTQDNITLHYEIIEPSSAVISGDTIINTGELLSGEIKEIQLISSLLLSSGKYTIKAWVASVDNFACDDTVVSIYSSGKISLPLDEFFTSATTPNEFISEPRQGYGTTKWEVTTSSPILSAYAGTNMLSYTGLRGSRAIFKTRQLDLYGTVLPKMDFWYYHDAAISEIDLSKTTVSVVADNDTIEKLTIFKGIGNTGWEQYTVLLDSHTTAQCVYIIFESLVSADGSEQYIDRIRINSDQDLAVAEIFAKPSVTICDLQRKNVYAVLRSTTNQTIDFGINPTNLKVELFGQQLPDCQLTRPIAGNSSDTILIAANVNFTKGVNRIKAYLSPAIDGYRFNDTANLTLDINPTISLRLPPTTSETFDCVPKGAITPQKVWVKNMDSTVVSGIVVTMAVSGAEIQKFRDTIYSNILPKDSVYVEFSYIVPSEKYYYVDAEAYLSCDSALENKNIFVRECVDIDDMIITLLRPQEGTTDDVGTSQEIAVLIKNESQDSSYVNVNVWARIEDTNGDLIKGYAFNEIISYIDPQDTVTHVFKDKYTVPDVPEYFVSVYLSKRDNYLENDTVLLKRYTKGVGIMSMNGDNVFSLQQNIPNPANNRTKIGYSIPTSGEVIFNVQSVTGQILYTKVLQSEAGKHVIDLNTSDFAAGVYFYSIEYQGQKLLKRMSVKN